MQAARVTIVCLTLSLALAASPAFGAEEETAGAGSTSCIVKIAVDPEILPLNPTTVDGLIRSSGVAGKAASDTLGMDAQAAVGIAQDIRIEWLSQGMQSNAVSLPSDPYDDQIMKELQEIYDDQYRRQMGQPPSMETPDGLDRPKEEKPADAASPDRSSRGEGGRIRGRTNHSEGTTARGMGMGMGIAGMGSMGGTMGSRGMTYGMMGGGMGGGAGGFGMGGMYGAPTRVAPAPGQQQTAIVRLLVQLPVGYRPRTGDFVKALIDNLEKVLNRAYDRYERTLDEQIEFTRFRRDEIERQLLGKTSPSSPESMRVQEQLHTIVDLSMFTPEMPFSEAIETLRHSVEPPLSIIVLWKELFENCEIEPTTPIDMDGLPQVKLETALRTLLKAVSGGLSDVSYQIDDDVVVIGVIQKPAAIASDTQVDVHDLANRRRELSREVQNLEMEIASSEARQGAIERQIAVIRKSFDEKLGNDIVTRELQDLVKINEEHLSLLHKNVDAGRLPESELAQAQESLARAKIELARRREELTKTAGGSRLEDLNDELSQMAIDATEQRARLNILHQQLDETKAQLAQASALTPQAARLQAGRQALDIAERRIAVLTNRMVCLQPPTVAVIGGDAP